MKQNCRGQKMRKKGKLFTFFLFAKKVCLARRNFDKTIKFNGNLRQRMAYTEVICNWDWKQWIGGLEEVMQIGEKQQVGFGFYLAGQF